MIKIAVVSLGRNLYSAFSLNQEYPLATVFRAKGYESREEIERILIVRFHSQRTEYKKMGYIFDPVGRNGKKRGGWKFIWMDTKVFWNKIEPQTKVETLVNEPGLTIKKEVPLQKVADLIAKNLEQMYIAEENEGTFKFTPVEGTVVAESDIPSFISIRKKDK